MFRRKLRASFPLWGNDAPRLWLIGHSNTSLSWLGLHLQVEAGAWPPFSGCRGNPIDRRSEARSSASASLFDVRGECARSEPPVTKAEVAKQLQRQDAALRPPSPPPRADSRHRNGGKGGTEGGDGQGRPPLG